VCKTEDWFTLGMVLCCVGMAWVVAVAFIHG
jgi:hypothetical protein